jgi:NitT/TauT family transport system substrate-binding protein
MEEARLAALQDFYVKEGLVRTKTPVQDLYTNQFVK